MSDHQMEMHVDVAEWSWLKPHISRDAIILVDPLLDLIEVGEMLAKNQVKIVQEWILNESIAKPTQDLIQRWNSEPSKKFNCLIVQPFVLIQDNVSEKVGQS